MEEEKLLGKITEWVSERGFGFVKEIGRSEITFCHISSLKIKNTNNFEGSWLIYDKKKDPHRDGYRVRRGDPFTSLTELLLTSNNTFNSDWLQIKDFWKQVMGEDIGLIINILNEHCFGKLEPKELKIIFTHIDSPLFISSLTIEEISNLCLHGYFKTSNYKKDIILKLPYQESEPILTNIIDESLANKSPTTKMWLDIANDIMPLESFEHYINNKLTITTSTLGIESLGIWQSFLYKEDKSTLTDLVQTHFKDFTSTLEVNEKIKYIQQENYVSITFSELLNNLELIYNELIFLKLSLLSNTQKIELFRACQGEFHLENSHFKNKVIHYIKNEYDNFDEDLIKKLALCIMDDLNIAELVTCAPLLKNEELFKENVKETYLKALKNETDLIDSINKHKYLLQKYSWFASIIHETIKTKKQIIESSFQKLSSIRSLVNEYPEWQSHIDVIDFNNLQVYDKITLGELPRTDDLYRSKNLFTHNDQSELYKILTTRNSTQSIDLNQMIRTNYLSESDWTGKIHKVNMAYDLSFYLLSKNIDEGDFTNNAFWYLHHAYTSLQGVGNVKINLKGAFEECTNSSSARLDTNSINGVAIYNNSDKTLSIKLQNTLVTGEYPGYRLSYKKMNTNDLYSAANAINAFRNSHYDPSKYVTHIPLEKLKQEEIKSLKHILDKFRIITVIEIKTNPGAKKNYSISKGNRTFFDIKINYPNNTGEYCSGRTWPRKKANDGLSLFWCDIRGTGCAMTTVSKKKNILNNKELHHPYKNYAVHENYRSNNNTDITSEYLSLHDRITFLNIFTHHFNNKTEIDHDKYTKFLGWLNELNRVALKLNCRNCSTLMLPISSNYAARRITQFKCTNSTCKEKDNLVYLNHCYEESCYGIIDSRDSKQCSNGWYICSEPGCHSCCNTKTLERRNKHIEFTTDIERAVQIGHNDRDLWFCHKCGGPVIKNELGKLTDCANCNSAF